MRKLFFWALVGGFGGFVVGKLGASLVTTTLGFFLPGWSLAAFGAGRFICAANLLLYGLPYLAASEFGGLVRLGNKFSFPAAISMSLATAFGLPFAINSSIHASVAKIRSAMCIMIFQRCRMFIRFHYPAEAAR